MIAERKKKGVIKRRESSNNVKVFIAIRSSLRVRQSPQVRLKGGDERTEDES
jgi:hypothetical protein